MARIAAALPFPFDFDPARTALVMIDMQRDFLEPGGFGAALGNDVGLLAPAVAGAERLLAAARSAGLLVIHTRECHAPDLADCPPAKRARGTPGLRIGDAGPMGRILIRGQPGVELTQALAALPGEVVIDKPGKGAFHATSLDETLQAHGVTHLIFGGVTTEVCVQSTMREANDRGYACLLVEDATDSYFPAFKAAVLEMVRAQGAIVGWTATVAEVAGSLSPAAPRAVADPDLDSFIDNGAKLLGIPLDPAWREGVKANVAVILRQAHIAMETDIPDETDPAPVFGA